MKKMVVGFLAGALFMIGATTFADDIQTLVGKKIEGETAVTVDGTSIGSAIIVDGKSYAPVRSIAEASGLAVGYGGAGIALSTNKEPVIEVESTQEKPIINSNTSKIQVNIEEKQRLIDSMKKENETYTESIKQIQDNINSGRYSGDELEMLEDALNRGTKMIKENEESIKRIEEQLQQ
ncbi:hypothetical protein [Paenibacillus massiliensis]|uniref:hypothetical protein n=1 Tax=Paenibacillus massiliensis TaxID=225917 RepID=UPI0006869829|nr:hypothetical protein [Paenibacillus massiliensis]